MSAMPALHAQLLGDFGLFYNDAPIAGVRAPRLVSLLAYLLLHRHAPQSRQHLAFLFWPDSSEAQARTNLRQLVHHLRKVFPDIRRCLEVDASSLLWRPDVSLRLDVADFERAVGRAEDAALVEPAEQRRMLEQAARAYGGDLLPHCYDDWLVAERARLRQRYASVLERLVYVLEEQREYARAAHVAQQLLQHDPLREESYRSLMRLYALSDDRARALQTYRRCADVLARELSVEPAESTRQLYERLLNGPTTSSTPSLHAVRADAGLPLVGRRREWERLRQHFQTAASGVASLVIITGEAGIGKTRLAEELVSWAARQSITTAVARSYAAEGRLAYAPVAAWLRSPGLRTALGRLNSVWLADVARLLPELQRVPPEPHPKLPQPGASGAYWERLHLFEALSRAILAAAPPILLLLDDLQWCDQDTLEWLRFLLRYDSTARLLVLATVRAEEVEPATGLSELLLDLQRAGHLAEVSLGPLDATDTATLATHVAGGQLDPAVLARLYSATEGNPLFLVETVRARLTADVAGAEQAPGIAPRPAVPSLLSDTTEPLPPRVHAVIARRLGQLSPQAREVAAIAAAIGRAFTLAVLTQAARQDAETLARALDELWQRRIVREQGVDGYDFSHDQIRDVAYATLPPARRRLVHAGIARALETVFAGDLDPVSARLAGHYEHAGLLEQAIPCYQRAAEVAQRVYANEEASALLQRALALLRKLPAAHAWAEAELAVHLALGAALVAASNYATPEVSEVYARAGELCEQLGRPPPPPVLRGLALAAVMRGQLVRAADVGAQLLAHGQREDDPVTIVEAHYVLGVTQFWRGNLATARTHLEQAVARYDKGQHNVHVRLYAQDPGLICRIRLAWDLWYLGYPGHALERCREVFALTRELAHPASRMYVFSFAALLHIEHGDLEGFAQQLAAMQQHGASHGLSGYWSIMLAIYTGWLTTMQGAVGAGLDTLREALAAFQRMGWRINLQYFASLLARAYWRAGQHERALATLADTLASAERMQAHFYDAELYRLQGELLLEQGAATDAVEQCFHHALGIAHRQGAKSLELRAATSLSRLWQRGGKTAQAYELLVPIYGWFTDAFEAPDLRAARDLLEELRATSCAPDRA